MPKAPKGTTVYILTKDGENKHVTGDAKVADRWIGLGNEYDYQAFIIEDYEETPPTAKQTPQRTQERGEKADTLMDQLQEKVRKFKPRSHLLR